MEKGILFDSHIIERVTNRMEDTCDEKQVKTAYHAVFDFLRTKMNDPDVFGMTFNSKLGKIYFKTRYCKRKSEVNRKYFADKEMPRRSEEKLRKWNQRVRVLEAKIDDLCEEDIKYYTYHKYNPLSRLYAIHRGMTREELEIDQNKG